MFNESLSLFDPLGAPVAVTSNDHLVAPDGAVIGLFLAPLKVFVGLSGRYLGEIAYGNRLVARIQPLHVSGSTAGRRSTRAATFGSNITAIRHCKVPLMPGFRDVSAERLRARQATAA